MLLIPVKSFTLPNFNTYNITHYIFDLHISNLNRDISGSVCIHADKVSDKMDTVYFLLSDEAHVDSILADSDNTSFSHVNNLLSIPYTCNQQNTSFIIQVFYSLTNAKFPKKRGILNKTLPNGKSISWTISEPNYSYTWFPCKQVLTDKIDSAYLFFTVDDSLKVGSNGILTHVTELGNHKKRFEWKTNYPTTYYLFSFAVADYLDYSFTAQIGNNITVPIVNYVYNDSSILTNIRSELDITQSLIAYYSDLFGIYPFYKEKYGHCQVPSGGGMEHQTMSTMGSFNLQLVSHELAHQWFGNNITCSSWNNIWINEGFATYAEYLAYEYFQPDWMTHSWLSDAQASVTSEPGGSVYVPDSLINDDSRVFDYRITYQKGALILHMIRHRLNNDDLFFKIMSEYGTLYQYSNADASDFRNILEKKSGMDFTRFFEQWYYGNGYPIIDVVWYQENDSLFFEITQENSYSPEPAPFELYLDLQLKHPKGDTTIRTVIEHHISTFGIKCNYQIHSVTPNPDNSLLLQVRSVRDNTAYRKNSYFRVFPNPASTWICIENIKSDLPFQALLYNADGILINQLYSATQHTSVSLENLRKGIYRLIMQRMNHNEVFTVVKL